MEIRREIHALLETIRVARGQFEGRWSNSLPVTGLSKHVWGVPCCAWSARRQTRSALDKIGCIHADIPPHTDHTNGAGTASGLEPVLAPCSGSWFRDDCWIAADPIFETRGYTEGGNTTRLTAERARIFVARSVFPTNKTCFIAFVARRYWG